MRIVLRRKELIAFYSQIIKVTSMVSLIFVPTLIPYLQKRKDTHSTFNSICFLTPRSTNYPVGKIWELQRMNLGTNRRRQGFETEQPKKVFSLSVNFLPFQLNRETVKVNSKHALTEHLSHSYVENCSLMSPRAPLRTFWVLILNWYCRLNLFIIIIVVIIIFNTNIWYFVTAHFSPLKRSSQRVCLFDLFCIQIFLPVMHCKGPCLPVQGAEDGRHFDWWRR